MSFLAAEKEKLIENPNGRYPLSDDYEVMPNPIKTNTTDFGSLLTEYGRSIIKSAIDHSPTETDSLKTNIINAKEKVVVKHKDVENELRIAQVEIQRLKANNLELRKAKAALYNNKKVDSTRIQDLEQQLKFQTEGKERDADLLVKETKKRQALEVELGDLKKDKKWKRELVAAIWEDAEKVKLN